MRSNSIASAALLLLALAAAAAAGASCARAPTETAEAAVVAPAHGELLARIDQALNNARAFLVSQQSDDGAWRSRVYGSYKDGTTLTPYVLTALHLSDLQHDGVAAAGESFARGRRYVWSLTPDASGDRDEPAFASPVYTAAPASWVIGMGVQTSSSVVARQRWLDYLRRQQLNAANGWSPTDPEFGGFGYTPFVPRKPPVGQPRPPGLGANLSATVYGLGALRMAGIPRDDPAFRDIVAFVSRCQNFSDDPDQRDPSFDDGGFFFTPTDPARNKAGAFAAVDRFGRTRFHSYGGTTADGMRALLHAGLPPDNPRVVAARDWLERHFRADTNPGVFEADREVLRDATYYYYCWSVAHAFMHLRVTRLRTDAGDVDWPDALARVLLERQEPDGAWRNRRFTDGREDDPLVATPAATAALVICRQVLSGAPAPAGHAVR